MKRLLILLLLSGLVSGDMVSYFNNQFIPVEDVGVQGSTVVASYNMDLMLGLAEFNQDIAYIFGALAKEYPNSESILIVCYAEGEPLYDYSVPTAAVKAYAEDELSDDEFLAYVSFEEHQGGGFSEDWVWLLGGAGVFVFLGVLFLAACVAVFFLFHRKK